MSALSATCTRISTIYHRRSRRPSGLARRPPQRDPVRARPSSRSAMPRVPSDPTIIVPVRDFRPRRAWQDSSRETGMCGEAIVAAVDFSDGQGNACASTRVELPLSKGAWKAHRAFECGGTVAENTGTGWACCQAASRPLRGAAGRQRRRLRWRREFGYGTWLWLSCFRVEAFDRHPLNMTPVAEHNNDPH